MQNSTGWLFIPRGPLKSSHFYQRIPILLLILLFFSIIITLVAGRMPSHDFKEGRVFTKLSTVMLFWIGVTQFRIYKMRALTNGGLWNRKSPCLIWLIMSAGFFFLALDETGSVHEKMDKFIHNVFVLEESPLTDRLDDFILASYGLIGIFFIFIYQKELLHFKAIWNWLRVAFFCFALMVIFDLLSNDRLFFYLFSEDDARVKFLYDWTNYIEDFMKLLGVGFFTSGFLKAHKIAKEML